MKKVYLLHVDEKWMKRNQLFLKDFEFCWVTKEMEEKIKSKIDMDRNSPLYEDYLRIFLIYENGGLLLDGTFEIISSLSLFFEQEVFLGYQNRHEIATNLLWAKTAKNPILEQILSEIKKDDTRSITSIFSKVLQIDLASKDSSIVKVDDKMFIFPYDYFYPIDDDGKDKEISENLKVVFYQEGKRVPKKITRKLRILKKYGLGSYRYLSTLYDSIRFRIASRKYALQKKMGKIENPKDLAETTKIAFEKLKEFQTKNVPYIIIHHPRWMGVTSATKELFQNLLPLQELYDERLIQKLAEQIIATHAKQIIFSAFTKGWDKLAIALKKLEPSLKIKSFWHGSHSQVIEEINWKMNTTVIELHQRGIIDVMGTCKESLLSFYLLQGYRAAFVKNTVSFNSSILEELKKIKKEEAPLRIGMYAAGLDWRKNMYNQLAAASLLKNAVIDVIPLSKEAEIFASKLDVSLQGVNHGIKREELLKRMAQNHINLYVTFSECAPMLPIESMEAGTICLTGSNHHYFKGTPLEEYLIVDREDDVMYIYEKIQKALDNKEIIFKLYHEWKKEYDKESKESVQAFLNM